MIYFLILLSFCVIFGLKIIDDDKNTMHSVINKTYMEKLNPLIEKGNDCMIANVRVTSAT
jgi:hypothetical protein